MLAKIAHSYAIALLGVDGFKPYLQEFILGKESNYGKHVGGGMDQKRDTNQFHRILTGHLILNGTIYLFMKIRLFARLGPETSCPPSYWVIIGELTPTQLERLTNYRARPNSPRTSDKSPSHHRPSRPIRDQK
jgi:hypothetical protein